MATPKVTVQILGYGNAPQCIKAVESVLASNLKGCVVQLVENGGPIGSYEELRKAFKKVARVKVIRLEKNRGFTGGNLYGLKSVRTRYVILLNDDVIVEKDWGNKLLEGITEDGDTAVAGSRAYAPNESPDAQHNRCVLNVMLRHVLDPPDSRPAFAFADGASLIFDLKRIPQPFDEDYFIYHEDTYVSLLARLKGFGVKQVPASRLLHYGSAPRPTVKPAAAMTHERNRLYNILLFYSAKSLVKLFPLIIFDIVASNAKNLVKRPKYVLPHLRAYAEVAIHLPSLLKKRAAVQAQRRVGDEALFKALYGSVIPKRHGVAAVVNRCFLWYLQNVGIRVREEYAREEGAALPL